MFKTTIDFWELWIATSPFLLSTVAWSIIVITFHRSIKLHATKLYWTFGVLSFINFVPYIFRMLGVDMGFTLSEIPVLGRILMELSKASYFIHPMLVIIMFMGALDPKQKYIGRLMSIRKELSIIVGFPVLAHATKRVIFTLPHALEYFVDNEAYIQNDRYYISSLGSGISSAVYVIGAVMTVIFLVLWVTSFDSVHRRLGAKKWRSVQRWAYVLYALLFIHAVGIKASGAVRYSAKEQMERAKIELVEQNTSESVKSDEIQVKTKSIGYKSFSFLDVEVTWRFRSYANILIYILVYGSYLILRLRKVKRDRERRLMVSRVAV